MSEFIKFARCWRFANNAYEHRLSTEPVARDRLEACYEPLGSRFSALSTVCIGSAQDQLSPYATGTELNSTSGNWLWYLVLTASGRVFA